MILLKVVLKFPKVRGELEFQFIVLDLRIVILREQMGLAME